MNRQFWRHMTTRDVYAVELVDKVVIASCGPLNHEELTIDLDYFNYTIEDAEWLQANEALFVIHEQQR